METVDTDTSANECRTKHSNQHHCRLIFIATAIIVVACLVPSQSFAKESIDFDAVDLIWFKDAAVAAVPRNTSGYNNTVPLLKIHGLKAIDADDQLRIKPTFSSDDCANDESDMQIVNDIFPSTIDPSVDLLVALNNFQFGRRTEAFLCIKSQYDADFQPMGANSTFTRWAKTTKLIEFESVFFSIRKGDEYSWRGGGDLWHFDE